MSPATAARRLAVGLALFGALSAHADEAATPRAAAGSQTSAAAVAAAFAPVSEEPASRAIAADEERSAPRDGRSEAPSELRDVPRFGSDALARTAAAGPAERARDSSARLSVRGSGRAGLLLGVSVPF